MSLQRIINVCETLNIDRRKVVGVQYTRSEIAKITETPTRNPWRFNLTVSAALLYAQNRDLLEEIDRLDRRYPEIISFSNNPNLSFMFAYQGDNKSILSNLTISSFLTGSTTLTLGNLPPITGAGAVSPSTYMFKKGDIVQVKGYPYPFSVQADVLRGSGTTISLTVHRPNFITTSLVGLGLNVGNDCQFKMFCPNMPTYKLVAALKNNPMIQWTSDFQLVEHTGDTQ